MPTCARKHQLTGTHVYHVYNRSNRRLCIFHSDHDYRYFMKLLKEYTTRFRIKLYNWALLFNHFHLLLEIDDPRLISRVLAGLNHAYTIYYHKKYDTCGFLWQGRFKLQPIQKERYLVACGRYIERNPVRAQQVQTCSEWPYSSARFYCTGMPDGITCENPLFHSFGSTPRERQLSYGEFLREGDETEEKIFRGDMRPAGDNYFLARLVKVDGRYMPRRTGRPREAISL